MSQKVNRWVQLEQPRLGTRVVLATDEFFGAKDRLIDPAEPVFVEDKYDEHGKWMDGWESRRRRDEGHDYCVIRLGVPGVIHGFDVDTSYFTGNFPPQVSIEACVGEGDVPEAGWVELVPKTDVGGDSHHYLDARDDTVFTHVRLHIYPDGGIARLRIFGEIKPDFADVDGYVDLAALEHGGRPLSCSDQHYGSAHNLLAPGRGANMGDGWETARRRGPGNDWVIMALATPGIIDKVVLDTAHFKGNYPDRAALHASYVGGDSLQGIEKLSLGWPPLLPEVRLAADSIHEFSDELEECGVVSHVRLSIYPDGGVSRLRLYGRMVNSGDEE